MSDLKTQLIKLGSTNPELRPHIREVLKVASNEVIVGPKVRISWKKSGDMALTIEELPDGRKKLLRKLSYYPTQIRDTDSPLFYPLYLNRQAKFNSSMTYDQAVSALLMSVEHAKDTLVSQGELQGGKLQGRYLYEEKDVPYLEVEPADYKPITVAGKDFTLKSEWSQFSQKTNYSTNPHDMDPSTSGIVSKTKASARKLFKILKANPDVLRGMDLQDFMEWLTANRIAYDQYFSSWR